MYGLTPMRYSGGYREVVQDTFGGMDRRPGAGDGALAVSLNMSTERYPALTVRPRRGVHARVEKPNGFFVRGCVAWVSGGTLVVDGQSVAELTEGPKVMAGIQKKICVWPDKMIYDRQTGELTEMEATWEGDGTFSDGTYAGEPASANTITVAGDITHLFRAGDGVVVESGGTSNGAFVIQEIEFDGIAGETEIRFLENTWLHMMPPGYGTDTEEGESGMVPLPNPGMKTAIRIRRRAPELDGVFEHHNRLWGWHGGTICCCALGDPSNWEVFGGDAVDSWELVTGSSGDITGGVSYGGRPVFFKEDRIIRLYGDYPAQYSTSESESLGVESGSGKSLAVAGDTLYYKSPKGIMAYSGGYPYPVGEEFGESQYRNAVAGSDGVRYYISMQNEQGKYDLFCYDTRYRVWHEEEGVTFLGMGWHGELYGLEEVNRGTPQHAGTVYILGKRRVESIGEEGIVTKVEFADFTEGTARKKGVGRLALRLEIDQGTKLRIFIRYDSRGDWMRLQELDGELIKDQTEIIVPIRRCDHYRIKIEGSGLGGCGWTLHSLTRRSRVGSNKK